MFQIDYLWLLLFIAKTYTAKHVLFAKTLFAPKEVLVKKIGVLQYIVGLLCMILGVSKFTSF